jgi:hypothetical protein
VCSKFLALNGADLHVVKTVHPVRRALFAYGLWHALVASLENVFEFSAILSVISVSKQLDRSIESAEATTSRRLVGTAASKCTAGVLERQLLLCPQNRVLCRLGDTKFDHRFGWNLDLLLSLGIEARTCLPLLLYQLAKTGQDEFPVLFDRFVGEGAKRIEEYSSGSFVGLGGSSECDLKFGLGHVLAVELTSYADSQMQK